MIRLNIIKHNVMIKIRIDQIFFLLNILDLIIITKISF